MNIRYAYNLIYGLTMYCCSYSIAIVIGFEMLTYTFTESDDTKPIFDVFLAKQDNGVSERTFRIVVNVNDPSLPTLPASIRDGDNLNDYSVTQSGDFQTVELTFPPDQQRLSYDFTLYGDEIAEGNEGFVALATPNGSITFTLPSASSTLFCSTTIIIEDNDCKYSCCCVVLFQFDVHYHNLPLCL